MGRVRVKVRVRGGVREKVRAMVTLGLILGVDRVREAMVRSDRVWSLFFEAASGRHLAQCSYTRPKESAKSGT